MEKIQNTKLRTATVSFRTNQKPTATDVLAPTEDRNVSTLENALTATMSYFDLAQYPLTLMETHRFLWGEKTNVAEVYTALQHHPEIENTSGFYHLKGKAEHVQKRLKRYRISEQKIKKLKPFLRWVATLPYVRTIMISNSVGMYNARAESDLDLFIITAPKKIWSTRFWAAATAEIFGLRPKIQPLEKVLKRDKICLCCYATTDHLNMEAERITEPDIDFIYWMSTMFPIYDPQKKYHDFFSENRWLRNFLPNLRPYETSATRVIESLKPKWINTLLKLGSWEKALRGIQNMILNENLRRLASETDSRVVLSDQLLKLHVNDRRLKKQRQWEQSIHGQRVSSVSAASDRPSYHIGAPKKTSHTVSR